MALPTTGHQFVLNNFVPVHRGIDINNDFSLKTVELPKTLPAGQVLIRQTHLSNDPAQRSWIVNKKPDELYMPPVHPGHVMGAFGVGRVLASADPNFSVGDLVAGMFGWRDYIAWDPATAPFPLTKLPPGVDAVSYLALGMTALTAYFGLLDVAKASGEDKVIVVSAALGATGSAATQIAKRVLGVKQVWGIVGSDEKAAIARDVGGCDLVFNYKNPQWKSEFRKAAKEHGGVNVYFDNVGGVITDCVLRNVAEKARVVLCGAISGYDKPEEPTGITSDGWGHLIVRQVRAEGFVVTKYRERFAEASKELASWAMAGKIRPLKTVFEADFEEVPQGMAKLLTGQNTGKLITQLKV